MSDLEKILLTSALTIFGGVLIYVAGQLLSKLILEPAYELRKTIAEVRFVLSFYAPTIHTPIGRDKDSSSKAYEALMKSSSDLLSKLHAIPAYDLVCHLSCGLLPTRENVETAAVQLRGLSTHMHQTGDKADESIDVIDKRVEKTERLLGLKALA